MTIDLASIKHREFFALGLPVPANLKDCTGMVIEGTRHKRIILNARVANTEKELCAERLVEWDATTTEVVDTIRECLSVLAAEAATSDLWQHKVQAT